MANKRILDETTASVAASDDYLYIDGQTNGSRKITPENIVLNSTTAQLLAQHIADATQEVTDIQGDISDLQGDVADVKADLGDLADLETEDTSSIVNAINEVASGGSGLTTDIKTALLQIAQKVAYIDDDGQDYYDDLYDALYAITAITLNTNSISMQSIGATSQLTATTTPAGGNVTWSSSNTSVATVSSTGLVTSVAYGSATITASAGSVSATCSVVVAQATCTGITATYTQSGSVYEDTNLNSLKSDLVVTASWSNGTTSTLTSSDYTLTGTLLEGTSVVTVSYAGQSDTFNVTVSASPKSDMDGWTDGVRYTDLEVVSNSYVKQTSGAIASYNGWDRTGYVPCDGANYIVIPYELGASMADAQCNWFYDSNHDPVSEFTTILNTPVVPFNSVSVPSNASYFIISGISSAVATCVAGGIIPDDGVTLKWSDGVPYSASRFNPIYAGYYVQASGQLKSDTTYSATFLVDCRGASTLTISTSIGNDLKYCHFFADDLTALGTMYANKQSDTVINIPSNTKYFAMSAVTATIDNITNGTITITPNA